jgi:hypothetical protein
MKPFDLNDTTWDSAEVEKHRNTLITMRDTILKENDFEMAVLLSVTIGLLHHLANELRIDE